jgi:hypothetical protein
MIIAIIIGGFASYIAFIPSMFFVGVSKAEYKGIGYPSTWTNEDIASFTWDKNGTVYRGGETLFDYKTEVPYVDVLLKVDWETLIGDYITVTRVIPPITFWLLNFETIGKTQLYSADIINRFDESVNYASFYPVYYSDFTCKVWFFDTNSSRNDIEAAFIEGALIVEIAFGPEALGPTTLQGANLFWSILCFQAPEIFGEGAVGVFLNALIALPLWALIASIIAIAVFELIPF